MDRVEKPFLTKPDAPLLEPTESNQTLDIWIETFTLVLSCVCQSLHTDFRSPRLKIMSVNMIAHH
jgi:hypothetical protein